MKINRIGVFLVLWLCTALTMKGQANIEEARELLQELKQGVLLVRLPTAQYQLEALREAGRQKERAALQRKLYEEERATLLSFKNTFRFCPVYFFPATASDSVRQGLFEGILFDVDGHPVEPTALQGTIFTGEFSETPKQGIEGFILMDQNMVPLQAPFPFYQRKHGFLGLISRSKAEILEDYQAKLEDYYHSWQGKP